MKNQKRNTLKIMGAGVLAGAIPAGKANAGPKRGGTIRFAVAGGSSKNNFDPTAVTGSRDAHYFLIYNRLVQEVADTGELKPELATSWESKNKNKTWIVNLRKGVKFHDGSEMTADDVIYSIGLHTKEGAKSPGKSYFSGMKSIKKNSKYQIQFNFSISNPDLPAVLSLYYFLIVKNGHTDWLKQNGTGGYKITEFNPGVKITAKRRDDYWRDDSAWANKIEVIYMNDPTTQVNALVSGSVDIISSVPTNLVDKLKGSSKINTFECSGKLHLCYPMMGNKAPYNDNNVRMALKYAIDREKLIKVGMNGYGTLGNDNPISESYADYVPVKQISYDPDKAKHYLKKAGMSKLDVSLHTSNGAVLSASEPGALVYSQSAKEANINIKVVREPSDGYWSNVWMKKGFVGSKWGGRPTATMMFDAAYVSTAKWNESFFKNKDFDKLIVAAKESSSPEERKAKLGEAQRMVTEQGSVVVPAFNILVEASNSRIGGHMATKVQAFNNTYFDSYWVK